VHRKQDIPNTNQAGLAQAPQYTMSCFAASLFPTLQKKSIIFVTLRIYNYKMTIVFAFLNDVSGKDFFDKRKERYNQLG